MSGRDVVTVDFSKQDLWDFGDDAKLSKNYRVERS
mgnify:CR=1 FL=1